jgi:DNA-binding transcriptional regulator PaaX
VSRLLGRIRDRVRGQDLIDQVWHERDDTQVESLRERIERLRILERSVASGAKRLAEAGALDAAKEEEHKAAKLHERIAELISEKRILELRIYQEQDRYYHEGGSS